MKKPIFNRNLAFDNIVNAGVEESEDESENKRKPIKRISPALTSAAPKKDTVPPQKTGRGRRKNEHTLMSTTFYLTQKQRRALKLRAALSDTTSDKDQSAIVRAALDSYLSDTLKQLEV